jgi:hypothetical protein
VSYIQVTKAAFETVDWAETARGAYSAGVADPLTKMGGFVSEWYGTGERADTNARKHLAVMKSYKQVKDKGLACGRA